MPLKTTLAALALLCTCLSAHALDGRVLKPRPELTPGEAAPGCSLADLRRPGYSHSVRPPPGFTRRLKHDQMASGYQGRGLRYSCVEEDHLIPIGWCGNPHSERNLWPQLRAACGAPEGASAEAKDSCEYLGFELLRAGHLDLVEAQRGVAQDWIAYCRDVVTPMAVKFHLEAPRHAGDPE